LTRRWRCCAVLAALFAGVHATAASAATRHVSSPAQFQSAVATLDRTGGVIVLEPGVYRRTLLVGPRSSHRLSIEGAPGARVQLIELDHTRDVTVRHLTVWPVNADGGVIATDSQQLVFRDMVFTARDTRYTVRLDLDHSSNVLVRDDRFSHCGDNTRQWALCLLPRWASHVTVRDNWFHDCLGCDFIHGRAGPDLRVLANRFARALRCHHQWIKCVHQDMIELFHADGLVVRRNVFGVTELGGAQLYMALSVDHVSVTDNLFLRTDARAPGVISRVGILVGTRRKTRVPHDVEIINNTVLSGDTKPDHAADSIVLSPHYATLLPSQRPLIANNVFARQLAPDLVCGLARLSEKNVVELGTACGADDVVGDAALDSSGHPTAASTLVIDQADPQLAPARDLRLQPRVGPPDIGCYECNPDA
jgi:hypothetical protein